MKKKELLNACKKLGLEFDLLSPKDGKAYIHKVMDKFSPQKIVGHLSIGKKDSTILNTENNEFSFSAKFNESPIRLFFDQASYEKDVVFELKNGQKLGDVLEECFGMEYFISNLNLSFLVSVNWYIIEIYGDVTTVDE